MEFVHNATAAAELGCTVAGEAARHTAGHKAQEEGRHIAAGRKVAGTAAGEEEGLGCSRTGAWMFDQPLHEIA
jgi:hypothetical protein